MTRCKHCRAIAPLRKNRCSVCGILPGVKARDLSPDEKRAKTIRAADLFRSKMGSLEGKVGWRNSLVVLVLAAVLGALAVLFRQ